VHWKHPRSDDALQAVAALKVEKVLILTPGRSTAAALRRRSELAGLRLHLQPCADSDLGFMLKVAGHLYVEGTALDWDEVTASFARKKCDLPRYAWQRTAFWAPHSNPAPPLLDTVTSSWRALNKVAAAGQTDTWEVSIQDRSGKGGMTLVSCIQFLRWLAEVADRALQLRTVRDVRMSSATPLQSVGAGSLQLAITTASEGPAEVCLYYRPIQSATWSQLACARLEPTTDISLSAAPRAVVAGADDMFHFDSTSAARCDCHRVPRVSDAVFADIVLCVELPSQAQSQRAWDIAEYAVHALAAQRGDAHAIGHSWVVEEVSKLVVFAAIPIVVTVVVRQRAVGRDQLDVDLVAFDADCGAIMTVDLTVRRLKWTNIVDIAAHRAGQATYALSLDDVERAREDILSLVRDAAAQVLAQDPSRVGLEQPIANMGFDSIMVLQWMRVVEHQTDVAIPVSLLLNSHTLAQAGGALFELWLKCAAGTNSDAERAGLGSGYEEMVL
jgi:hypothetical protein